MVLQQLLQFETSWADAKLGHIYVRAIFLTPPLPSTPILLLLNTYIVSCAWCFAEDKDR